MSRLDSARRRPPEELRTLVDTSGLPLRTFAELAGYPMSTVWNALHGRGAVTDAMLNACRFALLRLGKHVEIKPIVFSKVQLAYFARQRGK